MKNMVTNGLLSLSKGQAEKYDEIDNNMKPEDLVYGKQSFNRYRMVIFFVSKFLTEIANIDEMYKMLN